MKSLLLAVVFCFLFTPFAHSVEVGVTYELRVTLDSENEVVDYCKLYISYPLGTEYNFATNFDCAEGLIETSEMSINIPVGKLVYYRASVVSDGGMEGPLSDTFSGNFGEDISVEVELFRRGSGT